MGADTFRRLTGVSPPTFPRVGLPRLGLRDQARVLLELESLVELLANLPVELVPFLPEILDVSPSGLAGFIDLLGVYAGALEQRRRELEEQAHQTLPKPVTMHDHAVRDADGTECSICLSPFQPHEPGVVRVKCGHLFHRKCLEPWFQGHDTCPVCRAELGEQNSL
jgi:hypothetical protein